MARKQTREGKRSTKRRVWCLCGCNRYISRSQASRHKQGQGTIQVRVAQELLLQADLEAGLIVRPRTCKRGNHDLVIDRADETIVDAEVVRRAQEHAKEREVVPQVDDYPDELFLDNFDNNTCLDEEVSSGDSLGFATRFNRLLQRLHNLDENSSDTSDSDSESSSETDESPSADSTEIDIRETEEMFAREFYNEVSGTGLPMIDDISEDIERDAAKALEGKLFLLL